MVQLYIHDADSVMNAWWLNFFIVLPKNVQLANSDEFVERVNDILLVSYRATYVNGYGYVEFQHESDAAEFLLKWS